MKKRVIVVVLFLAIVAYLLWSNLTFGISRYTVESDKLPEVFDGYKIVQVSDLHNAKFGKNNKKLISAIKKQKPDAIVMTGDFIDGSKPNIKAPEKFAKEVAKIAPCYYVSGNHEAVLDSVVFEKFTSVIEEYGIVCLDNASMKISKANDSIQIVGLSDIDFWGKDVDDYVLENTKSSFVESDYEVMKAAGDYNPDLFTVVLEHRPTFLDYFASENVDLVLSGHAHGGQVRIPFVGGVVAPDQGFFPKYDAGKYKKDKTEMIVSRGLGNSIIPVRVNDRPELVVVELKCKNTEKE